MIWSFIMQINLVRKKYLVIQVYISNKGKVEKSKLWSSLPEQLFQMTLCLFSPFRRQVLDPRGLSLYLVVNPRNIIGYDVHKGAGVFDFWSRSIHVCYSGQFWQKVMTLTMEIKCIFCVHNIKFYSWLTLCLFCISQKKLV